jgi:hypothetical protein
LGKKEFKFAFVDQIHEADLARPVKPSLPALTPSARHCRMGPGWQCGQPVSWAPHCVSPPVRGKIPNPSPVMRCRVPVALATRILIATAPCPIALDAPSAAVSLLVYVHASGHSVLPRASEASPRAAALAHMCR